MKRFLPLVLAAGMLLLSGCHTADVPEATLPDAHAAAGHEATAEPETANHESGSAGHEHGNSSYATASAFPSITPPSGKESVTPAGYWGPRKVNTDPYVHGGGHGEEGGHGAAPAAH